MSLPIYQRVAVTDAGDVIPGAEYTVINENTGVAQPIYSDRSGSSLKSAPYFADSAGIIQFYISAGTTFRVAASGGVGTYTDRYVYAAHPQSSATDTTAGSLMAVGAFGLGATNSINQTDANAVSESGMYRIGSSTSNIPVAQNANLLHMAGFNSAVASQLLQYTDSDNAYLRRKKSSVWSDWIKVITADSTGNVGIGTSSPDNALHVVVPSFGGINIESTGATSDPTLTLTNDNGGASAWQIQMDKSDGSSLQFRRNNVEQMRIDSAGNLALGSTNAYSHRFFARGSGADETVGLAVGANDTNVIRFYSSTLGTAGAIRVSAAGTSVAYNTSSDYRLKEDDIPMTGATERVKALRPINFAWKADGSRVDGFFAHELAEVVPEAASGTKDAMMDEEYEVTSAVYEDVITPAVEAVLDENGVVITEAVEESTESVLVTEAIMATRSVPDYQGIDQSKLVPLLTATIQELIARIEALEAGA